MSSDEALDVVDHLIHVCHATGATNWARSAYVIWSLPLLVICGAVYAIYWWDFHLMIVGLGALLNVTIGIILKEILRIPRKLDNCGVGYAMPSLHTFLAAYLAMYFSYLFFEASIREEFQRDRTILRVRIAANWLYLLCLSFEKVSIGHNTWLDVTMGWILGIPFAIGMIYVTSRFVAGTEETYVIKTD